MSITVTVLICLMLALANAKETVDLDVITDEADVTQTGGKRSASTVSRSLSRSLSPSASILSRKKAFTVRHNSGAPKLTEDEIEHLADQIFDGIVTEVHYHDHRPHKDHKDKSFRVWTDRYYRLTVLVTTVVHLREKPFMTLSHSEHEISKLVGENERLGGVGLHAHEVKEGDLVDVMLWEAGKRPAHGGVSNMIKGLEVGYVLIPKRPDENVEYRFFTQGLTHRMPVYREAYPTAGKELPAFEALIPNGIMVVKDDGSGDDTPMKERKARSKSVKWDL